MKDFCRTYALNQRLTDLVKNVQIYRVKAIENPNNAIYTSWFIMDDDPEPTAAQFQRQYVDPHLDELAQQLSGCDVLLTCEPIVTWVGINTYYDRDTSLIPVCFTVQRVHDLGPDKNKDGFVFILTVKCDSLTKSEIK